MHDESVNHPFGYEWIDGNAAEESHDAIEREPEGEAVSQSNESNRPAPLRPSCRKSVRRRTAVAPSYDVRAIDVESVQNRRNLLRPVGDRHGLGSAHHRLEKNDEMIAAEPLDLRRPHKIH